MRFGHEVREWLSASAFGTGIHCIDSPCIKGLLSGKVHGNRGKW